MIPKLDKYPINRLIDNQQHHQGTSHNHTIDNLSPFEDSIIEALSLLGQHLITNGRNHSDIVAAGFWLRKTRLVNFKTSYLEEKTIEKNTNGKKSEQALKAKGCVFHLAPGNVDTLFFYSIMLSVLCGNYSVLRISNKLSELSQTLIRLINQCIAQHSQYAHVWQLIDIIQYDHNDELTSYISQYADVRVIWGGNKTVEDISQLPLKNKGNNVCFPDRYSVAVVQLTNELHLDAAIKKCVSDIKPFFQQACSSPKVIYWLNTDKKLQTLFWQGVAKKLNEQLKDNENLAGSDLIARLIYKQQLPLLVKPEKLRSKQLYSWDKSPLNVVELTKINLETILQHCGLWVMLSKQLIKMDEIRLFDHCQTVTMFGVNDNEWKNWLDTTNEPMKRWVPAGQALAFSHVWDGIDLIDSFTI
ncbi:MAG: hypothetical protein ACI89T_000455 [Cognaticolwellia sp.]